MAAPVIQKAYIQDINRPIEVRHGGGLMFTGDAKADRISVSLYDCQTPFSLSGSVTATCIRNDGATVVLTGGITGGNTAYAVLEQSCFVVPGPLAVTIRVSAGGVSTTVLKAVYTIDQTTTEEIVDPGHVVPDISDIVAEYERMQAASDAAEAAAENANEAAQFATDDEWTNGDTLRTGRVYQTLHMANFEEETAGQYLRVISGNVAQAERVSQSGWSVYRYDLPHRMLIRLESIEKNTPTVQGVLPMAAVLTSGSTETLYSLDSDRTGTYILADALLVNYSTTLNASAIKSVSITAVANRQFEDVIVCLDHAADFDKIVVFGDSIFANYINSTTVGNGVMAQFASLMGLPVINNAVGGATLSTIQTNPKSVVQQVQDYVGSATPGGTPLYIIDGGTNDQYNGGAGLANLGQYTDGVNGITNTIYGATYAIINALLGFGAQPWQIVICTPIPKGIRGDAAYTATMDAQLTAIAGAMAEIAMVQQINLINGYGSPFDNLTTDTAKAVIMPDDTHPSVYGAKLYAERIFRLLGAANQREVTELKSAITSADYLCEYTLYDGYIGSDGSIISQSSSKEKYTSQIAIPTSGNIGCALAHSQIRSMWLCYALYKSNGDFINRTALVSSNRQSYNGIVNVANKDAAFICFTFRGYNDFNFTAYNPIAYNLNNVTADTAKTVNDIGVYEITFNVTAGTAHGSNDDLLPVDIKANDTFSVVVKSTAITGGQIFAYYTDGTNERIYSGNDLNQIFTATKNIAEIGLYIGSAFVAASGSVNLITTICGYALTLDGVDSNYCANVKSINHRGFTLAPENTLPAFKLSRKMGFTHVETDILWTSDDVPVLLHDTTINRTARNSDGTAISDTISIVNITYEQALTYDFGIYKGAQYAGTKIPTFTEFIILCKRIGLHPYVELKGGSQTQINGLVDITDRYGMTDHVTWISFYTEFLSRVQNRYAKARLGFVVDTIDSTKITAAAALKTSNNDVFINTKYTNVTTAIVEMCVAADMPLEVYTIDSTSALVGLDAYISGYTSNKLIASKVLYDENIS